MDLSEERNQATGLPYTRIVEGFHSHSEPVILRTDDLLPEPFDQYVPHRPYVLRPDKTEFPELYTRISLADTYPSIFDARVEELASVLHEATAYYGWEVTCEIGMRETVIQVVIPPECMTCYATSKVVRSWDKPPVAIADINHKVSAYHAAADSRAAGSTYSAQEVTDHEPLKAVLEFMVARLGVLTH